MKRTTTVIGIAALVMLVGALVASTAFTNATVERDTNIDVVDDTSAPISLNDGNSGNAVYLASNGEVKVDFTNPSGSSGVNPNATYELGDVTDANNVSAFNVTNSDSQSHDLKFSYAFDGSDPAGSVENVNFTLYDNSGNKLGSATDGSSVTQTFSSSQTVYVVVTVNSTTLTNSSDLSGTLTIETP